MIESSDLDPDLAPVFKQMSNDAFNKLKPIVLAHKKAQDELNARNARIAELEKGRIPESYYEHPQGYVLSPEFIQASEEFNSAQRLHDHWKKQLVAVREGAATYKDIAFNEQTNRYELVDRTADAIGESNILSQINAAQYAISEKQQAIRSMSTSYKARHGEVTNWVRTTESKLFPLFDAPEHKDKFDPVIQDTINKLPPAFQHSPLARMLAKSLVTNQHLSMILNSQTQAPKQAATISAEQQRAGPTAGDTTATTGKVEAEVTFDEFEKVKQGI